MLLLFTCTNGDKCMDKSFFFKLPISDYKFLFPARCITALQNPTPPHLVQTIVFGSRRRFFSPPQGLRRLRLNQKIQIPSHL